MNSTSRFTGFTVAVTCGALVLLGVACSAPPSEGLGGEKQDINGKGPVDSKGNPTGAGTDGGKVTENPEAPTPGTDAGPAGDPDQGCYALKDDACYECCETAHPAATTAYENAYDNCICGAVGAAGSCATECAKTYCDEDGPDEVEGDACSLCQEKNAPEDGTGACDAQIAAAFNATPDGVQLDRCYNACP